MKNIDEVSKDIFFRVIQRILSDFKQFVKLSGFNNLCKLQKYPDFMIYVNIDKDEVLYCIKVLQLFKIF